jgi:hypothetical protein
MLDNLNPGAAPRPPRENRDGNKSAAPKRQRDHEVHPVVEREVPLGQQSDRALSPSVHAWLDGELPEAAVRKGATAHDVEFWRQVSDQMERVRRMRTPEYVEAQIMAALPHHAPTVITPWWRREFVITPRAAFAAVAALIALVAAATAAFMSR